MVINTYTLLCTFGQGKEDRVVYYQLAECPWLSPPIIFNSKPITICTNCGEWEVTACSIHPSYLEYRRDFVLGTLLFFYICGWPKAACTFWLNLIHCLHRSLVYTASNDQRDKGFPPVRSWSPTGKLAIPGIKKEEPIHVPACCWPCLFCSRVLKARKVIALPYPRF